MSKKYTDKQADAVIRDVENNLKTKENKMKKLTIDPAIKERVKTLLAVALVAAVFYAGTQYQQNLLDQRTHAVSEAVSMSKAVK